jgi:hypothetical protein
MRTGDTAYPIEEMNGYKIADGNSAVIGSIKVSGKRVKK